MMVSSVAVPSLPEPTIKFLQSNTFSLSTPIMPWVGVIISLDLQDSSILSEMFAFCKDFNIINSPSRLHNNGLESLSSQERNGKTFFCSESSRSPSVIKKPEATTPPPAAIHTWEPPLKAPYETLPPDDRNRLRQIYVILPNEFLLNFMRPLYRRY